MNYGTAYKKEQPEKGNQGEPMTNEDVKGFALKLLHAETEDEVIEILRGAGYWDNHSMWRLYGDKEGNFAQIGNQQSYPEASLVEKVINSVDSRLMLHAALEGVDPKSPEAPVSVRDAVAMFFEGRRAKDSNEAGALISWGSQKRLEESRNITIAATGAKPTTGGPKMCLTICDQGEGQSPLRLPNTILSLNAKNKQRIRFVQGKFNMGGSGALRFCGNEGIQLVISRRHPDLAMAELESDELASHWAVTVVRREEPSNTVGEPVHSEFTFLAPVNAEERPRNGDVLSFEADMLPLMPDGDAPYQREIRFGTAIKLYEYETSIGQSNVLMKGGLLYALERLMPEIALPIRLHECRGYGGKEGSWETPIAGLVVRLEDGKGDNLEEGFPHTAKLIAAKTKMNAKIFAFKKDKASTYLRNEGVVFQINGQSHGYFPKSIFARKKVGLPRLKDSLLLIVDCSELSATQREDLFMSSRDRLSNKTIRRDVEAEIMEMLRTNDALKKLQQERRDKEIQSKLSRDKPLEEVLGHLMKASPTLRTIFLLGQRLSKPFAKGSAGAGGEGKGEGGGADKSKPSVQPYVGKAHPTYFDAKGVSSGGICHRNCEEGRRFRIAFKTDVVNQYFDRTAHPGSFDLEIIDEDNLEIPSGNFVLDDGDAFLSCKLPENAHAGDVFILQVSVDDDVLVDPFVNLIQLRVIPKQSKKPSTKSSKKKGGKGGGDKGTGVGIKPPIIIPVETDDDIWVDHHFTPDTACHVISDPSPDNQDEFEHTFYVNIHNKSLLTEMKYTKQDVRLMEAKFTYANVLFGLAMIYEDDRRRKNGQSSEDDVSVQDEIAKVTQAVAPVVLPIIDQLSGLSESELDQMGFADDDE